MGKSLGGKVALITGAGRGQGRSHALRLASDGADVIAIDICEQIESVPYPLATKDDLDETVGLVEDLGRQAVGVVADVRDKNALGLALSSGVAALGRVDIVLANAGIAPMSVKPHPDVWRDVIDVNLTGVQNTLQLTAPQLISQGYGGAVVLTSSTMRVIHRFDSLRVIYISGRRACMKDGLFLEMIGLPHTNQKKQAIAMYHTTGFSSDELIDICVLITSVDREPGAANWPPCLGLLDSVVATLAYLRHNRTQVEIGESLGVSQPTISRAITVITPLLSAALAEHVATADDLDPEAQYIVDGTLLPCWSWAGCKELYSGKHKTTGMNVQVACTIYGKLAWISDPVNGSRHDNYCLGESDVLRTLDPKNWIGDKGYIGNEMITPFRKPEGRELLDWQKEFNTEVNKIRWMIEQVISHFKNWTLMHTDYRRPLSTFATTISAVIGLHFYRMA